MKPYIHTPTTDPGKFTKKDGLKLFIGLAIIIAIVSTFIFLITIPVRERNNVEKNGIEVTATSNGETFVTERRMSKLSRTKAYLARYTFVAEDGKTYDVPGEKDYKSESNVKPGMKATIRYLADDPYHPEFITEE